MPVLRRTWRWAAAWIICIRPRPCLTKAHEKGARKIISRGMYYFMPNDGKALITAFEKDFPNWRTLAERPGQAK